MQGINVRSIRSRRVSATFALGAALLLVATPAAQGLGFGVDNGGIREAKASGWTPAYGQFWYGDWNGDFSYLESSLKSAKANGVIPVVEWYYWGDAISPNCIKYGCNGLSKGEWAWKGAELAKRVNSIMGSSPVIIVVETEFNKGSLQNWEEFDGMLASHISMLKYHAPKAKVALGFGNWAHYDFPKWDRAMSKADYAGIQLMRGMTRDTWSSYTNGDEYLVAGAKKLKSTFGKPIIVHDIALSSYKGESAQKAVIDGLAAKKGTLEYNGVFALVYRNVRDYNKACTCWYYGEAEKHFGLKSAWGNAKPAWWAWKNMAQGGSASMPSSGTTTTTTTSSGVSFTPKTGNEWWIQTSVSGSVTSVQAQINDGSWFWLTKYSWGWATSKHAPGDSTVQFRAKLPDGSYKYSATYHWDSGAIASGSSSSSTTTSELSAKWTPKKGNKWWIQTAVSANKDVTKVHARIDGGTWFELDKQSYGWTKSKYVSSSSTVQFRATATDGSMAYSAKYDWW